MTRQGYETLRDELRRCKSILRPQNIKAISEARAHGDLSENAEYSAAKERQSFIEGRINELEYKIAHANVIDPSKLNKDSAFFGCVVILENIDTGEEVEYQLVGPDESDVKQGRISVTSPIGKALLGKKLGDEIMVQVPAGQRHYEVIDIQ
jgi:transcription elongation factor GreA